MSMYNAFSHLSIEEFYSAIDANPDAPWCPTKVDDEGHAIVGKGKWGICEPKCPMPHGKILVLNFL